MINGYYAAKNVLVNDGLSTLDKKQPFVWLDCINPSKKELKDISDKTSIYIGDLEQGLDEGERPRVNLNEEYTQIIFSTPNHTKNEVRTLSFSTFLFKDKIITLRRRDLDVFVDLMNLPDDKKVELLSKDPTNMLYVIMQNIISEFFRVTDPIEDIIEKIDHHLFKDFNDKKIISQIFSVRKTLIYLHKTLVANREVISSIESQFLKQLNKVQVKNFRFLHNDIVQLIDMVATYRDILSGSLEIYLTSVSNNLNNVMKRLTVYASYVMVPTLISGIYGMNFDHLPELNWKYGYFFALGLMVFSIISMHILFKRKGWI